jgi:hypothetical protein
MNFALIAQSGVFAPLKSMAHWLISTKAHTASATSKAATAQIAIAPECIAPYAGSIRATGQNSLVKKPLRVVRVLEAGQARTSVGRMVISGRMADVCAELDRLAAREAALS